MKEPARILVVGGGYVGMYAALRLQRKLKRELVHGDVEVVVVDPEPYMTYQPFLPEAAAGSISPRHVVVPLRRVLPRCRIVAGEVAAIRHEKRVATVRTLASQEEGAGSVDIAYDELVLAPGSVSRTLPVPGLAEHGIGFTNVEEAIGLRNHVLEQLDIASSTRDPELRAAALTFVVVGGGYAGVEALGELEDMARYATRFYQNLVPEDLKWVLVEATDRILPEVDEKLGRYAVRELRDRNVDVRLETRLASYENRVAVLSDGSRLPARTLVWTAGVRPHPLLASVDLPLDARGHLRATATLQVDGVAHAWTAGDAAAVPDRTAPTPDRTRSASVRTPIRTPNESDRSSIGKERTTAIQDRMAIESGDAATEPATSVVEPAASATESAASVAEPATLCPRNAQHALRQARTLADNLVASLRGRPLTEYVHRNVGSVASLGLHKGVAHVYGRKLTGYSAWFIHRVYHLSRVPTVNRKARVLAEWILSGLFTREIVSLGSMERPRAEFELAAGTGRHPEAG